MAGEDGGMLRSARSLFGYSLTATDGEIGSILDLSFDDRSNTVRYIVANTGGWLSRRLVLLSPVSFGVPQWQAKTVPVALTKKQIEDSPPIDADKTVSRQHETELSKYYGWPAYWMADPAPVAELGYVPSLPSVSLELEEEPSGDPHLRSVKETTGYHIQAVDGEIGHLDDFIVDDNLWIVRYIVVDTRNWLPGNKVVISPEWISAIRWEERKVHLQLTKDSIENAPAYNPEQPINREYEIRLYDYYGRPKYW
jgi:hypothetical protein